MRSDLKLSCREAAAVVHLSHLTHENAGCQEWLSTDCMESRHYLNRMHQLRESGAFDAVRQPYFVADFPKPGTHKNPAVTSSLVLYRSTSVDVDADPAVDHQSGPFIGLLGEPARIGPTPAIGGCGIAPG